MSKVTKIGIVGRITEQLCDGQTIKTRVLYSELKRKYDNAELLLADTYQYMKHPVKMLYDLFICIKESQVIFVLLSRNGMRVIFPIINFLNRFFRKPIFHDCIGGTLDGLVEKYSGLRNQLNRFEVNWVESVYLKERLEKLGVHNVAYLPNFKRLSMLSEKDLKKYTDVPYRFCTFSRVNEAKGIGRAAEAIININTSAGETRATLDVYGPIEENYDKVLDRYIKKANGAIKYLGVADSSRSVEVLKNYYALLFPTTFYGEGFPGTLIDALCAGLPVIATDWHCNSEIITDGYTGYVYPVDKPMQLQELIVSIMEDADQIFEMRKNCLNEARKYDADQVMRVISEKMEQAIS